MNQSPGGLNGGRSGHINFKGKNNPFFGKNHSDESKNKMSKTKLESEQSKFSMGVKCYSLDGNLIKIYYNRRDLEKDGFNPKCVDNVLANRAKTHKKYVFK